MIASLHGIIQAHEARAVVLVVNGVGYRVATVASVLDRAVGDEVELHTYQHFGGETIELYGFPTADELGLFLSLLKVSGVGPRSAIAILSEVHVEALRTAIINADPVPLTSVSGVGRKTAERIILELSGTLSKSSTPRDDDALQALERLGYSAREAGEALRNVTTTGDVRERIRAALRNLNQRP